MPRVSRLETLLPKDYQLSKMSPENGGEQMVCPDDALQLVEQLLPSPVKKPHKSLKEVQDSLRGCLRTLPEGVRPAVHNCTRRVVATVDGNEDGPLQFAALHVQRFDGYNPGLHTSVYPAWIVGNSIVSGHGPRIPEIPLHHKDNGFLRRLGDSRKMPSANVADALTYLHYTCSDASVDRSEFQASRWRKDPPSACLVFVQSWQEDIAIPAVEPAAAAAAAAAVGEKRKREPAKKKRMYRVVAALHLGSHLVLTRDRPYNLSTTICQSYRKQKTINLDEVVFNLLLGTRHGIDLASHEMGRVIHNLGNVVSALLEDDLRKALQDASNVRNQRNPCVGNSFVREWQVRTTGTILFNACWPILSGELPAEERAAKEKEIREWFEKNSTARWMNHGTDWDLSF